MEAEVTAFSEVAWFCFVGYGIEHVATPREGIVIHCFPSFCALYRHCISHLSRPALSDLFLFNDQGDARGCQRVPENVLSSSKPFQGIFVRRRLGNTEVCRHPPT